VSVGVYVIEPEYLDESVPPSVSSPFVSSLSLPLSGAKYTPSTSVEIVPWLYRLSMNVGISSSPDTVPSVRSTGPKPMMPSTPVKPEAVRATPIDCLLTVAPPKETVSVYSVPETSPEP
jgi:hypothetical protein